MSAKVKRALSTANVMVHGILCVFCLHLILVILGAR